MAHNAALCAACQRLEPADGAEMCAPCLRQAAIAIEMGFSKAVVAQMLLSGEIDTITGVPGGRGDRGLIGAPLPAVRAMHGPRGRSAQ